MKKINKDYIITPKLKYKFFGIIGNKEDFKTMKIVLTIAITAGVISFFGVASLLCYHFIH